MRALLLALLCCGSISGLSAASLAIDTKHPLVRPGMVHRLQISGTMEPGTTGAVSLQILDGERIVFAYTSGDLTMDQLAQGITVNWVPEAKTGISGLICRASLRQSGAPVATSALTLRTLDQDLNRLNDLLTALPQPMPAQPQLWAEQCARIAGRPPTLGALQGFRKRLDALEGWAGGWRGGISEGNSTEYAVVDRADGGVHPWRLYQPKGETKGWALLCWDVGRVCTPTDWPKPTQATLEPLLNAGIGLVEVYPGADESWEWTARQRIMATWEAARSHAQGPWIVLTKGRAAEAGLLTVSRFPGIWHGIIALGPQPVEAPNAPWEVSREDQHWLQQRRSGLGRGSQIQVLNRGTDTHSKGFSGQNPQIFSDPFEMAKHVVSWFENPRPVIKEWRLFGPGVAGNMAIHSLTNPLQPGVLAQVGPGVFAADNIASLSWRGDTQPPVVNDGRLKEKPTLPQQGKRLGIANGPLDSYANGPFVIVVGTGEHSAAKAANERMAEAFRLQWAAQAQHFPRLILDTEYQDSQWQRHHLVLIGNPRSNAVLSGLNPELPVTWDHRSITSVHGSQPRQGGTGVALAWPHPSQPWRTMVILDGTAPYPAIPGSIPLGGAGDLLTWSKDGARSSVIVSGWP